MNGRETSPRPQTAAADSAPLRRTVALIGLMGAGKSAVGRRLAATLNAPFFDSDDEIVRAATMPIADIFENLGERHFREGERRVIARLLSGPPHVLATGGGAFMSEDTRALLRARAHVVWLRADLDTLVARCGRRDDRPLLRGQDVRQRLADLMEARHPIYAEAESVVESVNGPHEVVVRAVMRALQSAGDIIEGSNAPRRTS
ncbi:MAG: shikimate kinase [Pseudomonadota bacterium]